MLLIIAERGGLMKTIRTILVPVDFTAGSVAALRYAHDLSKIFRSHVHLLHVAQGPDVPSWAAELIGPRVRPVSEEHRLHALDRLAALIAGERLDPFTTTGLVRNGCAEQVIADYAETIHADLIVMGIHGDRDVRVEPIGQVVEGVLGEVRCPVLTVPPGPFTVSALQAAMTTAELMAC